jgi:hypothetical protein
MSNRTNPRRKGAKRTEHGPRWEDADPGAGSNATHVARARRKWKRVANRTERRTGKTSPKFAGKRRRVASSD